MAIIYQLVPAYERKDSDFKWKINFVDLKEDIFNVTLKSICYFPTDT
jgi:hypothetical protein